jgi:hypothetical protein
MFTTDIPEHIIDLARPESDRWREVIAASSESARRLVEVAEAQFRLVPELLRWIFSRVYKRTGGLYHDEIAAWAEALGVSVGTVTVLNCAYELSHLRPPKIFGCTAGIRWVEGLGGRSSGGAMVHVRCLDWPLRSMGPATAKFRFRRGAREFVAVSVPGCVGVLSGMVPGGYSVTINWAPPAAFPTFEFGPAFLLRDTLETCDTFDDAVRLLSETTLSTSVFYTVCGVERGQACIIERTPQGAAVRRPLGSPPAEPPSADSLLVQANHHVAECYAANNADIAKDPPEDLFSLEGSRKRARRLADSLANISSAADLETVAAALNTESVLNTDTCQQMAFQPETGELHLRRLVGAEPERRGVSPT